MNEQWHTSLLVMISAVRRSFQQVLYTCVGVLQLHIHSHLFSHVSGMMNGLAFNTYYYYHAAFGTRDREVP